MTECYDASICGLIAYKQWVKRQVPLKIGTIIRWNVSYHSFAKARSCKKDSFWKIVSTSVNQLNPTAEFQTLVLCRADGSEFVRKIHWNVLSLRTYIAKGDMSIVFEPSTTGNDDETICT